MDLKDENRKMAARLNELDDTMSLFQARMKYAGAYNVTSAAGDPQDLACSGSKAAEKNQPGSEYGSPQIQKY